MLGQIVGNYLIEEQIGQGGMGTVYRAVHTGIGKRAAIKVLRGSYSDSEEVVQRFFNEARAAARIEHPGIVDVYDFGHHNGRAYLIMELLDGQPLSASLAHGALPTDTLRRITRQIVDALAAAHDRGITHRDLKPDNIFLVPDRAVEGGTRIKLLDFGIAKLVEADGSSSVETRTGTIIGTPVYMSPEQCRGTGQVDHRADLYSVGCILFQMVTGRPPFERAGVGELISAHLTEPPPHVSALRADMDPALAALIMRLLEKSPDQRIASARALIAALDGELIVDAPAVKIGAPQPGAHLATLLPGDLGEPEIHAPPSVANIDTDDDVGQNPALATAETAYQSANQSTLSAAAAESIAEAPRLASRLPWLTGLVVLAAGAAAGFALYDRSNEAGPSTHAAPAEVVPDAAASLREPTLGRKFLAGYRAASGSQATRYASAGGWRSAGRDFAKASEQPGAPLRWRAAAELCRGYSLMFSGEVEPALQAMRRAEQLDTGWDIAKLGLARALAKNKDYKAALEAARSAEQLSPEWWLPIAEIAGVHRSASDLELAAEEYQRALAIKPDEPLLLSASAIVYHALHMDEAAIDYAQRALEADPNMLSALLILAERALEKGDGKTALQHAERILARQPRDANAKLAQADALLVLRKKVDARAAYKRALELADELHQDGGPKQRLAAVRKALSRNRLPRARHKRARSSRSKSRSRKSRSKSSSQSPFDLEL